MRNIVVFSLLILTACGTRKVATDKSIEQTKIVKQSEDNEATSTQINSVSVIANLDTSKVVSENKTIIEVFNSDGSLSQRITSISKSIESNYKRIDIVKKDSTASMQIKTSKEVLQSDSKVTKKTKETSANRLGFAWFGILLVVVVVGYWGVKNSGNGQS
jgi:cobalamin biosynthesis Mg chelatase CobN